MRLYLKHNPITRAITYRVLVHDSRHFRRNTHFTLFIPFATFALLCMSSAMFALLSTPFICYLRPRFLATQIQGHISSSPLPPPHHGPVHFFNRAMTLPRLPSSWPLLGSGRDEIEVRTTRGATQYFDVTACDS